MIVFGVVWGTAREVVRIPLEIAGVGFICALVTGILLGGGRVEMLRNSVDIEADDSMICRLSVGRTGVREDDD